MRQGKKIPSEFWNKTFLSELKKSMGIVRYVCNKLNVSPQSYYDYRLKNPVFARKATAIMDDVCIPVLEDVAYAGAVKGDTKLLMFLLRSRGGRRWNQDILESELSELLARWENNEKYKKEVIEDQRPATKAEKEAAKIYLQFLSEEDESELKDHPAGCRCYKCKDKLL